ncbi:hypothetical protein LMG26691_00592 [Achromobacter animicus]|nr:hypothetical protein LMG26691_00592 [Achromobacter animicus]
MLRGINFFSPQLLAQSFNFGNHLESVKLSWKMLLLRATISFISLYALFHIFINFNISIFHEKNHIAHFSYLTHAMGYEQQLGLQHSLFERGCRFLTEMRIADGHCLVN